MSKAFWITAIGLVASVLTIITFVAAPPEFVWRWVVAQLISPTYEQGGQGERNSEAERDASPSDGNRVDAEPVADTAIEPNSGGHVERADGPNAGKPQSDQQVSVSGPTASHSTHPSPKRAAAPPSVPRDVELEEFLRYVTPATRAGVATAVRDPGSRGAADGLVSGLGERGANILDGVFHSSFAASQHFERLRGGDGRLLQRGRVLAPGAVALLGTVQHSFQRGAYGLITCDLTFGYTILRADGSVRARRTHSVRIPAYDEATALRDAIDALLDRHAAAILADLHP